MRDTIMAVIFSAVLFGGHIICLAVCAAWVVALRRSANASIIYPLLFLLPLVSGVMLFAGFALSGERLPPMMPCLVSIAGFIAISIRDARRGGTKVLVDSKRFVFGSLGLLWSTALVWFASDSNFMGAGC